MEYSCEYITSLQIDSLRGIRNITLPILSSINIITGPNGSGKTTVLDAIDLLANPTEPLQYWKVANGSSKTFRNLFDKSETRPRIRVAGKLLQKPYFTELLSYEPISDTHFFGYHYYGIPKNGIVCNQMKEVEFSFNKSRPEKFPSPLINIKRLTDHAISLDNIAKDKLVKEKVLSFLSLFDSRFSNIYSPDFKTTYIVHESYGNLDTNFFSEGIRKILKIAELMSNFHNGILLLDDFECQLSPQTLYEAVSLLYSLAKEKQIQLFITTHSQELIDEWLDILNFYHELSKFTLVRLKSDGISSSFTQFTGKEAYELRIEKELDFRYEYARKGERYENIF